VLGSEAIVTSVSIPFQISAKRAFIKNLPPPVNPPQAMQKKSKTIYGLTGGCPDPSVAGQDSYRVLDPARTHPKRLTLQAC